MNEQNESEQELSIDAEHYRDAFRLLAGMLDFDHAAVRAVLAETPSLGLLITALCNVHLAALLRVAGRAEVRESLGLALLAYAEAEAEAAAGGGR